MQLETQQQIFMLFYAIFWGAIASVQPRWKAFQFPLIFEIPEVLKRVCLSLLVLNIFPLLFFGYVLWALEGRGPIASDTTMVKVTKILIQGVIPAFGIFGLYRIWLGTIECFPKCFYKSGPDDLPEKYRHVEPTYRIRNEKRDTPTVDLGEDAGSKNLLFAGIYLIIASIAPWTCFW